MSITNNEKFQTYLDTTIARSQQKLKKVGYPEKIWETLQPIPQGFDVEMKSTEKLSQILSPILVENEIRDAWSWAYEAAIAHALKAAKEAEDVFALTLKLATFQNCEDFIASAKQIINTNQSHRASKKKGKKQLHTLFIEAVIDDALTKNEKLNFNILIRKLIAADHRGDLDERVETPDEVSEEKGESNKYQLRFRFGDHSFTLGEKSLRNLLGKQRGAFKRDPNIPAS